MTAVSDDAEERFSDEDHGVPLDPGKPWARVVQCKHPGRRADVWIAARFPRWSRTQAARFVRDGLIWSLDRPDLKPSALLRDGERLRVNVPGVAPDGPPPPTPAVLYEDSRLLVVNKPPGMLAHPVGERFAYAVVGLIRVARPGALIDLVHRLDRDTSGTLILSKDRAANIVLKKAIMEDHVRVVKEYLAIVHGHPTWTEHESHEPLGKDPASGVELRRSVRPDGDASRTAFRVVQRLAAHSLVACRLFTGRTHQIRVHLHALGHPLLGDKLYGQPDDIFLEHLRQGPTARVCAAVGFPRHALHAWRITLPHPDDGAPRTVEAPLPEDMGQIVAGAVPSWPPPTPDPGALPC